MNMITEKDKAEAYVRQQLPELMELSFGCWVEDPTGENDWFKVIHEIGICTKHKLHRNCDMDCDFDNGVEVVNNDEFNPTTYCLKSENLKIVGHPIQLQHWLRVLEKVTFVLENGGGLHVFAFEGDDIPSRINFNLTTGQPATEEDYKAFNSIVGV